MNADTARALALETLTLSETACVTTLDDAGRPDSRAMFNLRRTAQFPGLAAFFAPMGRGFGSYFATNLSARKVAHAAAHGEAAVYYALPGQFRGLCVKGRLEVVDDPAVKKALWQPGWEVYRAGGWQDPDNGVLRMVPATVRYYHQFELFDFAEEA